MFDRHHEPFVLHRLNKASFLFPPRVASRKLRLPQKLRKTSKYQLDGGFGRGTGRKTPSFSSVEMIVVPSYVITMSKSIHCQARVNIPQSTGKKLPELTRLIARHPEVSRSTRELWDLGSDEGAKYAEGSSLIPRQPYRLRSVERLPGTYRSTYASEIPTHSCFPPPT